MLSDEMRETFHDWFEISTKEALFTELDRWLTAHDAAVEAAVIEKCLEGTVWRDTIEEQRAYIATLTEEMAAVRADQIAAAFTEYADELERNPSAEHWDKATFVSDVRNWGDSIIDRAQLTEGENDE